MVSEHTSRGGQVNPWQPHDHDSHGEVRHIHATESTYSFGVDLKMEIMAHFPEVDIADLMYFRGLVMGWAVEIRRAREATDLTELEVYGQNFSVVTAYVDASMYQSLMEILDRMLIEAGIDPICSLSAVTSSNMAGVGYVEPSEIDVPDDEEEGWSGALYIHFASGGVYRYDGVPPEIAEGLFEAESPGGFFYARIKNKFEFEKVVD